VNKLVIVLVIMLVALDAGRAYADCRCVAVAGDVAASVQADVAKADGLYARGDFSGALAIYGKAYATSKDASLLYAQGMAEWQLGSSAQAKAKLEAYLKAGGTLAYRDRAEASLRDLGAGVSALVGTAVGATGAVGARVEGAVDTGIGAGAAVTGELRAGTELPKQKVGHTAGIALGVIAIAALGVVGIHSIAAGVSTKAEFDAKFDIGLGVAGVAVGVTAIYVAGLTAAAGTAGSVRCASLPAGKPIVAPYAMPGGGGLAAAMTF
jgi:hypothetical protein